MILDEFSVHFEKLVSAFHVQKPEQKAQIYFEHLRAIDFMVFGRAVEQAVKESEKFPTIAKLLSLCAAISPNYGRKEQQCNECDGFGTVSKWRHTFRGRCIHGEQVSKLIALVPIEPHEKKYWYGKLNKEWNVIYGKDLIPGKSYQGVTEPDVVSKTKELFGMV